MREKIRSGLTLVVLLLLLCGCQGKPLPEGMDEETLLKNGREVAVQLAGGDYQGVLDRMREDVAASVAAEDIQNLVIQQTDGAGTDGSGTETSAPALESSIGSVSPAAPAAESRWSASP